MFRPRPSAFFALLGAAALLFPACSTIYTDTYAPVRNHYKPLPEKSNADLLPPTPTTPPPNNTIPPLTETPPAVPAPQRLNPAPEALPAPTTPAPIPGLDPIPGAPAPAM